LTVAASAQAQLLPKKRILAALRFPCVLRCSSSRDAAYRMQYQLLLQFLLMAHPSMNPRETEVASGSTLFQISAFFRQPKHNSVSLSYRSYCKN
jgi:hypothetical protein